MAGVPLGTQKSKIKAGDIMGLVGSTHDGIFATVKGYASTAAEAKAMLAISHSYAGGFFGLGVVLAAVESDDGPVIGALNGAIAGGAAWGAAGVIGAVLATTTLPAWATGVAVAGVGAVVGWGTYEVLDALIDLPPIEGFTYKDAWSSLTYADIQEAGSPHQAALDEIAGYQAVQGIMAAQAIFNAFDAQHLWDEMMPYGASFLALDGTPIFDKLPDDPSAGLVTDGPEQWSAAYQAGFGFTSSSPSIDHSAKDDPGYYGGKPYSGYGGQNSPSEMNGKGPGMGAGSSGSSVGGSSQTGSHSSGSSHNFSHEGGAGSSHQGYHNGYGGGGYSSGGSYGGGKGGGSSGGSYGGGKDHSGKDDSGYGGGPGACDFLPIIAAQRYAATSSTRSF